MSLIIAYSRAAKAAGTVPLKAAGTFPLLNSPQPALAHKTIDFPYDLPLRVNTSPAADHAPSPELARLSHWHPACEEYRALAVVLVFLPVLVGCHLALCEIVVVVDEIHLYSCRRD